jgi:hypothetical protein
VLNDLRSEPLADQKQRLAKLLARGGVAALVRLIRIIASDQLVASVLDYADGIKRRHKSQRRDMGEVIGFKRKKLAGFAPSECCAPESDGA